MLLGDLIVRLQDDAVAGEALLALGDIALTARLRAAAAAANVPPGEFASQLVGRFVNEAGDEEWLTLVGRMARAGDPGEVFLRHALSHGLAALPAAPRP